MKNSISKIKRFIKKIFDFSEERLSIEIMFSKEKKCAISEEEEIYENILYKIKHFFKKFFVCLKQESSVEIVFPKEDKHKKEISDISDIK